MAMLPSCNSNSGGNNGGQDAQIVRFVTLASKSDDGSSYTYYDAQDNPFTLTTTLKINNTDIKPGHRLILAYNCNWGYADKSGAVDALNVYNIINGTLSTGPSTQLTSPQYYVEPSQTGPYLNVQARVSVINQPKSYRVVMDETTVDSNWPTVYLFFESDNEGDGAIKEIYASFDMSAIWNNDKYDGYTLKTAVTAFTGSSDIWNFPKPKKQTITPAN